MSPLPTTPTIPTCPTIPTFQHFNVSTLQRSTSPPLLSLPPMIISYQWLLEYLPQPLPVEELSRVLTSIGLEVEAVEKAEAIKRGLEGLVIGEVLTAAQHPNADKLKVTTVNIGAGIALNI